MNISNNKVSDIAKALSLSERRVQQLVKEGVLPVSIDGKYDLVCCIKSYEEYIKSRAVSRGSSHDELNEQRARLLKAQAEKAELELEVLKDKYIEVTEVEFEWSNLLVALRSRLLAMPSKLVRSLAAAGSDFAKIERILEDEIYEALTELSRYDDDEADSESGMQQASPTAQTHSQ